MFVLRSKVKVTDVSTLWNISGYFNLSDAISSFAINDFQIGLRLPDVLASNQSYGRVLIAQEKVNDSCDQAALDVWNDLEVLSAIYEQILVNLLVNPQS